jgi:uncharacterized protein (TIGR03545 family)
MKNLLSWIRWKYVAPLLLVVSALLIFFFIFFDPLLAKGIEWGASKINKAKVDVSGLKTKIFAGRLTIERLQVTDRDNVMKNIVEAGPMVFQIELSELVEKHLIIPQAGIKGLAFNTDRKTSGELKRFNRKKDTADDGKPSAAAKLVEKYKDRFQLNLDGLKDQAKAKVHFDPKDLELTKQANALKLKADTLPTEWKTKIDQLDVDGRLKKIESDLNEIKKTPTSGTEALTEIPKSLKKLKDVKENLNQIKSDLNTTKASLSGEIKGLSASVANLKNAKQNDLSNLLSRFNLDFADPTRLVEGLIGPSVLSRVRTTLHYVQVARQSMPSKKEQAALPVKPRGKGLTVEFPTPAALPRFWLHEAYLAGTFSDVVGSGQLMDVTTNPPRIGKPMIIDLKGDKGLQKFFFKGILDSVKEESTVSLAFDAKNLEVTKLLSGGGLAQSLKSGSGDGHFSFATVGDNGIEGQMALSLSRLKLDDAIFLSQVGVISGTTLSKEDVIKSKFMTNIARAIEQMPVVQITADIAGSWDDPQIKLSSNLIAALTNAIKNSVGDLVRDQKKELEAQLDQLLATHKAELDEKLAGLNSKLNEVLGSFDPQIQEKINQASGLNLTPSGNKSPIPGLKIPSLDKLFK